MKQIGIRGAVRGKVVKTTIPDTSAPCPRDKVNRVFRAPAPNLLWVSDFTYVSTWQGFVYVAFVIDTFADRIVGWRVSRSAKTDFVLDALELLIIDELGFVPLSKTGAELLFEMISQRYERGATLITSNLPFDEWTETFGTERLTGALLDRLTHHVNILEMNGESYRLAQSRARKPGDNT